MFHRRISLHCFSLFGVTLLVLGSSLYLWAAEEPFVAAPADVTSVISASEHPKETGQDANVKGIQQMNNSKKTEAVPGKHMALLISVNEYDRMPSLQCCDDDMAMLEIELKKFGYDIHNIHRMHEKANDPLLRVSRNRVPSKLKDILNELTGENDVLLIAYSGHGIQEGAFRYLCPPDAPEKYVSGHLIPLYVSKEHEERHFGILNIVEDQIENGNFKGSCFLFIDACRNGNKVSEETNKEATKFPSMKKLHIFSSCDRGEVSYEDKRYGHGLFMGSLIEEIKIADGEKLDYKKLVPKVRDSVVQKAAGSGKKQTPSDYNTESSSGILGYKTKETLKISLPIASNLPTSRVTQEGQPYSVSRPITRSGQLLDSSQKDQDEQNVFTDIVQLPGLNGEWWFQEMPWYIPHARFALASYLLRDGGATWRSLDRELFDTDIHKAQESLWRLLNSEGCKAFLHSTNVIETITTLRKEFSLHATRSTQRIALEKILNNLKEGRKNEGNIDCFDLYTFAVLEHQIALSSDGVARRTRENDAKKSYENALIAIETESKNSDDPIAILFYQLCLADYSRLLAKTGDKEGNVNTFKELTESLRKSSYKNSLFQIAVFTENARNASMFGLPHEAARSFQEAEARIAESRIARTHHPLVAHYNEQCGWFHVDYWRLPQAWENFDTAYSCRNDIAKNSSNPVDKMYVTYGLHAMGTISRFMGNNDKAREHLEEAEKKIKEISGTSRGGLSLVQDRLNLREANTLERLGDLVLYNGVEYSRADRLKAIRQYESGVLKAETDKPMQIRLTAKKALLLLEQGGILQQDGTDKFDTARECLKDQKTVSVVKQALDNPSPNMVIPFLFFRAAGIAVDLREAVEKKDEKQFIEARTKMREFLERFHLFSRDPDGQKRDTMELRMHCAAMLLEADVEFNKHDLANADSNYLALCLYILSEKDGIHAYLRPYYERQLRHRILQLRQLKEEDVLQQENTLRSIAMGIQRMRNVSVLNNIGGSADHTILAPELPTRGSGDTGAASAGGEKESENRSDGSRVLNPTQNPLIDPMITLVVFYFPSDSELDSLALIIPPNGQPMESIVLSPELDREKLRRLHRSERTDELKTSLEKVRKRIDEESKKVAPFLSEEIRQSVVISWSDESCWSKDSRERITRDMFPYKEEDFPVNVTVQ